jgi:hypothetical protein
MSDDVPHPLGKPRKRTPKKRNKQKAPVVPEPDDAELSSEETMGSCFDVLSPKRSKPTSNDSDCPESDGLEFKPATIPHQPPGRKPAHLSIQDPSDSSQPQKAPSKKPSRRRATVATDWWQKLDKGEGSQAVLVLHSQWSDDEDDDFPMPKVHIPVRARGSVPAVPRRSGGRLGGRGET